MSSPSNSDLTNEAFEEHERVVEELRHDTYRLSEIIKAQAELLDVGFDLERFYGSVLNRLDALTKADGTVVEIVHGKEMVYEAASGLTASHVGLRLDSASSLSGKCVELRQTLYSKDTLDDPRVDQAACIRVGVRSMVTAPLFCDGQAVGALKIMSKQPNAFSHRDLQTLQLMAGLVGSGIVNRRAFAENQRLLVERELAVKALSSNERRLRAIVDSSQDAFVSIDSAGYITDWNLQAERLFGWSAAEALGSNMAELIIPENMREAHYRGMAYFVKTGTGAIVGKRVEIQGLHRKGTLIPMELSVSAVWSGSEYVANAFIHDISERKRSEALLAANEKRLTLVTDNLPALISYIDDKQQVQFMNATWNQWLGVDRHLAIGRPIREVVGEQLYEARRDELERALSGETVSYGMETKLGEQERYLQTTYIPEKAGEKVMGVYALTNDLTHIKEVERELLKLNQHDSLTGLFNRQALVERLQDALHRSDRAQTGLCLFYLDIDRFKNINDTHGHAGGDTILKEFSARLMQTMRITDTVARQAGDEFVIVSEGVHSVEEVECIADKILAMMRPSFTFNENQIQVGTSIGACIKTSKSRLLPEQMLASADEALYEAKRAGRRTYKINLLE